MPWLKESTGCWSTSVSSIPIELHDYAVARFAPDVVAAQIIDVYRGVLDGR